MTHMCPTCYRTDNDFHPDDRFIYFREKGGFCTGLCREAYVGLTRMRSDIAMRMIKSDPERLICIEIMCHAFAGWAKP